MQRFRACVAAVWLATPDEQTAFVELGETCGFGRGQHGAHARETMQLSSQRGVVERARLVNEQRGELAACRCVNHGDESLVEQ